MDALRSELGDLLPTEPGSENLLRFYALLVLTKGSRTTLEDVHHAWALWTVATNPDHPSIVPFDQLTAEVQEEDQPFLEAIHRAASRIRQAP